MGELLTMAEAAAKLGICAKTLREHVRFGEISYIAMGRGVKRQRRMFEESDLEAFKERRRRTEQCQSISPRSRRTSTTTSSAQVTDFTALRNARRAAKQKRLKE